ncbi:MAG: type II secretion system F family protein, partial [Vulcanimicrobiota bacterium]
MSLALPETLQSQPTSPGWTSPLSASLRELALLTRQMAVMYRAGVPILSAVKALAHQTEEPRLAFLLMGVLWSLK